MNKNSFKNFFTDKRNWLYIVVSFLGAYLLFPNYFEHTFFPLQMGKELWLSLDPSWEIALNYAKLQNLTWGTDVVFTYGPLSHLFTRVGRDENKLAFLLFDLFVSLNYFLVFFISFKKSISKITVLLLIFTILLLFPLWIGSANAFVLMAFLVFWIRLSTDKPKWIYYLFQIVIIVLLFFTKFNSGLIAFPLFLSGIIYNFTIKENNKFLLASYMALPIILVVILCNPLKVDFFPYIHSGFEIVSGYNDVMYLKNQIDYSYAVCLIIIAVLTLTILMNIYTNKKKEWFRLLVVLFLFGTSIFVLYKQAFVRADIGHLKDFFIFIPLLMLCNLDLYISIKNRYIKGLFLLIAIVPIYFVFTVVEKEFDLKEKFTKKDYFSAYKSFTPTSGLHIFDNNTPLPTTVLQKIGNATVDVFPWNIQLLLENKLNYLPRPIIQSYSTYTPYLQNLNFEHYNSSKGPKFILYDYASVDERYPLFDEPKLSLLISYHYEVVEVFDYDNRKILLLQKKKDTPKITFTKIKEYAMYFDSPIIPKEGIYYEVYLYHNIKGKMVSVLEHAPEVALEIYSSEGVTKYKTSKMLLEGGLFSSYFIGQTSDFMDLIQLKDSPKKIKAYLIKPLHVNSFKDKIRIIEYKITQ